MDEEDSQDELINRNASHGKGKRPVSAILTDEEDGTDEGGFNSEESENDSEEGDAETGDDEDDNDDDEEDDSNDSCDGEEDSEKAPKGVGRADGGMDLSSDEDAEKCPICLNSFHQQPVATPESCEHYFCLDCILEWSKNASSCPVDRIDFKNIFQRKCYGGSVQKMIAVPKSARAALEEPELDLDLDQTNCEVCGRSDREDRLLLCDGCDVGYHMECLTPPLSTVPVEEWFCPACAASNPHTGDSRDEVSEDEVAALVANTVPTTSRLRSASARPTRAIARTWQSERVRATVNRNRISQARGIQHVPRYLVQSTWLDETIEAVVAGLNTAEYVRDLTPHSGTTRRRKTAKRRRVSGKKGKRRRRRVRKPRSRRKQVAKTATTARSRLARSLGIVPERHSFSVPTVYRPTEQSLGSMRADIGAPSLSIYGDPFDLDPFSEGDESVARSPAESHLPDIKRPGLSRSALRSHQPVARPVPADLHRRGLGMPEAEVVAEAAPVPDLLGSILTAQSILMMDSSEVVINRDGSLKAIKPVTISSPKSRIPSGVACESGANIYIGSSPSSGSSAFNMSGGGFPARPSPPFSFTSPPTPTSPQQSSFTPQRHPALPGGSRVPTSHRSYSDSSPRSYGANSPAALGQGRAPCVSPSTAKETVVPLVRKPPPKPVWIDVFGLPRIPKIKREPCRDTTGGNNGSCGVIPDSSMNNRTGHHIRQQTSGQGSSGGDREKASSSGGNRQQPGGPGHASALSGPLPSNPGPSAVSFRINSSGNPWHARRLGLTTSQGDPSGSMTDEPWKKLRESKRMLLSARVKAGEKLAKSEIYDPFEPTGSDSDSPSSISENETSLARRQEGSDHEVKTEPVGHGMAVEDECLGDGEGVKEKSEYMQKSSYLRDGVADVSMPEQISAGSHEKETATANDWMNQVCREGERSQASTKLPQTSPCSSSASSYHSEMAVKPEPSRLDGQRSCTGSGSSLSLSADHKPDSKGQRTASDRHSSSSSPGPSLRKGDKRKSSESRPQDRRGDMPSSGTDSEDDERPKRKWKRSRSRDRRRSCSGSGDRPKRRNYRRDNHEQKDEKQRVLKEKWRGRSRSKSRSWSRSTSRSRSRSWERKKGQVTARPIKTKDGVRSSSKDGKYPNSRSWSRERKEETCPSNSSQSSQNSSQVSSQTSGSAPEEKERDEIKVDRSASVSVGMEMETPKECMKEEVVDEKGSHVSIVKEEKAMSFSMHGETKELKEVKEVCVSHNLVKGLKDLDEIEVESPLSLGAGDDVRCHKGSENLVSACFAENVKHPMEAETEKSAKIKQERPSSHCKGAIASMAFEGKSQDGSIMEATASVVMPRQIKTEPLWSGESAHTFSYNTRQVLHSGPNQTAVTEGCHMGTEGSTSAQSVSKTGLELQHTLGPVKLEALSADDIVNVGRILDSLTSLKRERAEGPEAGGAGSGAMFHGTAMVEAEGLPAPKLGKLCIVEHKKLCATKLEGPSVVSLGKLSSDKQEAQSLVKQAEFPMVKQEEVATVCQETPTMVKQEDAPAVKAVMDPASVGVSARSKQSVKRVTWNLKEAEEPLTEKTGKLSHFRLLQSSREVSRKPNGSNQGTIQDSSQPAVSAATVVEPAPHVPKKVSLGSVPHGAPCGLEVQPSQSQPDPGDSAGKKEGGTQDPSRKDKYMKKLHMQERAVEEVKLAIKPFYQKRDITKEEYKEILRKAVQKVCHSKSGEINPVKVANLVKAYVDKYKHARKHRRNGEEGKTLEAVKVKTTASS